MRIQLRLIPAAATSTSLNDATIILQQGAETAIPLVTDFVWTSEGKKLRVLERNFRFHPELVVVDLICEIAI